MAEEYAGRFLWLEPWEIPGEEHAQSRMTVNKGVSIY